MKRVIIIGGGIAGLTAGVYAQKAGFESIIYEKHKFPGGECTGWDRGDFHIDGCIHWLTGTKEGSGLYNIWKEIGGLKDGQIYRPKYFNKTYYGDKEVILYRDLQKLKKHLLEIAPEDEKEIKELSKYIKTFANQDPFKYLASKPPELMNFWEKTKYYLSMMKLGSAFAKLSKITVAEYLDNFKSQALRVALQSIVPEEYCAYVLPSTLGTFISGNGDIPVGGSRLFAENIAEKYKKIGGKLELNQEVKKILLRKGKAKAIILEDGTEVEGDYIIPACDLNITLKKLLEDKYNDPEFKKRYNDEESFPLSTSVQLAFAVDDDLSQYPESLVVQTEDLDFEDGKKDFLLMKHYCYQPSFAPKGKSIVTITYRANYDWWKDLSRDRKDYNQEKKRLAEDIIKRMEKRFPELEGKIESIDVATPLTYERYCGAYKGSWMSFGITPDGKQMMHDGRIEGIKNLFMAGQWLMTPGGLPTAALTGKWAVQRILKEEE
ncbi:phytoene desaturase family protein [Natronospora cellulosivora (SeqCode)]